MKKEWLCFYLFADALTDELITAWLTPLLTQLNLQLMREIRFFFIRYNEGGPHLRVRIYIPQSEISMTMAAIDTYTIDCKARCTNLRINKLNYSEYHPEVERYGGEHLIYWAEMQFVASSRIITAWFAENATGIKVNSFIMAIRLHLAMFFAMKRSLEECISIIEHFINAWLPVLYTSKAEDQSGHIMQLFEQAATAYQSQLLTGMAAFWQNLRDGDMAMEWRSYLNTNAGIATAYEKANLEKRRFIHAYSSFMHMTHNRLGIKNHDEAFVAFLLKKCILYMYA